MYKITRPGGHEGRKGINMDKTVENLVEMLLWWGMPTDAEVDIGPAGMSNKYILDGALRTFGQRKVLRIYPDMWALRIVLEDMPEE